MGACASTPKTLDDSTRPEPLPTDANVPAVEENQGGEQINEAPLVDLSEPTAEAEKAPETKAEVETKEVAPVPEAEPAAEAVVVAAPAAEPAAEEKKVEAAAPAKDAPKA